jgi:integrase/recombinase XerD
MNEITKINNKSKIQIHETAWNSLSEATKAAYKNDYDKFFAFVKKNDSREITASDIWDYIKHLQSINMSNNTIMRKIASLSRMFKILMVVGEIEKDPMETLKQLKKLSFNTVKNYHTPINMSDIKKLSKITKNTSIYEKKTIMIIRTLARTAMRVSEFAGIRKDKIKIFDENNVEITIIGKGQKQRSVFMEKSFLDEIYALYPDKEDFPYLFYNKNNKKYDRKHLWLMIKDFCQKRIGQHVHPHMLRHTCATYLLTEKKVDLKVVQQFLGHSDISTTMVYIDSKTTPENTRIKI